jgi:uncharacterized protein YecT (DUF1311 family)
MRKLLLAATVLLVFEATPAFSVCENAQTQADMNRCMANEADEAEIRLRDVERQAETRLGGDTKAVEALKRSSIAWMQFRDAECARLSDAYRGGSIQPLVHAGCLQSLTDLRAQVLAQDPSLGALPRDTGWRALLDQGTYWDVQGRLDLDANCDGVTDTAIAGIRAETEDTSDRLVFVLAISDGASKESDPRSWTLELPIGGDAQKSLCGPVISLGLEEGTGACPLLLVDDSRCDTVRVHINPRDQTVVWERN